MNSITVVSSDEIGGKILILRRNDEGFGVYFNEVLKAICKSAHALVEWSLFVQHAKEVRTEADVTWRYTTHDY